MSFILRRTAGMVPMLIVVSIIAFLFVHLTPGDPIRVLYGNEIDAETYQKLKEKEGFNDPLYLQYTRYVSKIVTQGDFGIS
ncbi:glutathione ABC transporter permease GsiC, partial [Bacillus sp. SIMBA_069]